MRINGIKVKGKNTIKEKQKKKNDQKKKGICPPGFNPAPQLSPTQKVSPYKTEPCDCFTVGSSKLIESKYFSLPFTLFEPCGAVFIVNSKTHLRKNSLNEYFKTFSHYIRVYSLSGFV